MRELPTGTVTFLFADIEGSMATEAGRRLTVAEALELARSPDPAPA